MKRNPYNVITLKLLIEDEAARFFSIKKCTKNTVGEYIKKLKTSYGHGNDVIIASTLIDRADKFWSVNPFTMEDTARTKNKHLVYVAEDTLDKLCELVQLHGYFESWKHFEEVLNEQPFSKIVENLINCDGDIDPEDQRYLETAAQASLFFLNCRARMSDESFRQVGANVDEYLKGNFAFLGDEESKVAAKFVHSLVMPYKFSQTITIKKLYHGKEIQMSGWQRFVFRLKNLFMFHKRQSPDNSIQDAEYEETH